MNESDYKASLWLYIITSILAIINFITFLIIEDIKYGIGALFFLGFAILMTQNLLKYDMIELMSK